MSVLRITACAGLMMLLSGCASGPPTLPDISPDLMNPPCRPAKAGRDSDEDLLADIETAQCLRRLRLDTYRWQAWYRAVASFREK